MFKMIKRIFRNAKSKYIVNQIEWFEGALIDQGRDYYPFGLADYCCYQPDAIKNELIRLRDCRKEWVNSLKRNDYQLYVKLYPDEGKRENGIETTGVEQITGRSFLWFNAIPVSFLRNLLEALIEEQLLFIRIDDIGIFAHC